MEHASLSRRQALAAFGGVGLLAAGGGLLAGDGGMPWPAREPTALAGASAVTTGYAPDGLAGRTVAFGLRDVALLDSAYRQNQARNTSYLLFLDPERMLRSFRVNYGVATTALPLGGWELPTSQVRGHTTGHLLTALGITYANTGNTNALARGRHLVGQLAVLQARAGAAGFNAGYLSAFPEQYFDWLEAGRPVWSPYYMIHKYLAGLMDQYQLAGDEEALQVAIKLGDWVAWRTGRLPYEQMQMVLQTEFGGMPEALANLYTITGSERYLAAAQRFYHAAALDPLADGIDQLDGVHANMTVPKIIACVRMWEETGSAKYRDIAVNFWDIVTKHHTYVNGGVSNHEHFHAPDVVAGQLSNFTCENCASYNMLKLTRLLQFHQPWRTDLVDYYERVLFNQMLGEQDPTSPHGHVCYYTGLSPGAYKRQPLNYFPAGDPTIYATDYDTFTCDNATGLETSAKFADTIYTQDADGVYVNQFIPSQVRCARFGIVLRQTTGFPDDPLVRIDVVDGINGVAGAMTLRVRVPSWLCGQPSVRLNGAALRDLPGASAGGWVAITRTWQVGDKLEVTLPMALSLVPAPDHPSIQALTFGPVVLGGVYATDPGPAFPMLDTTTIEQTAGSPMTFSVVADGRPVTLIPVTRAAHQYYTVYWDTTPRSPAPPASPTPRPLT